MIATPPSIKVPIQTGEDGAIRVSGTRVTLATIIGRYNVGDSPEEIHAGFERVPLTDIYAIIAYYLANKEEIDQILQKQREEGERIIRELEANRTPEQKARDEYIRELIRKKREETGE